jgi:hypothetical protein
MSAQLLVVPAVTWHSIAWIGLSMAACIGFIALLSPRRFASLAALSGIWIDTTPFFRKLDKPINIDDVVLRRCRLFGVLLLVGAAITLAFLPSAPTWRSIVWITEGTVVVAGVLALASPRLFTRLAKLGGVWIDTNQILEKGDKPISIDHFVVRHSRVFGFCVLIATVATGLFLESPVF